MKGLKIVLIVILSIIVLGLCVLLGMGISGKVSFPGIGYGMLDDGVVYGNYELVMRKEVALGEVAAIDIDYSKNCTDVTVYEGTDDVIIVEEYANFEMSESDKTIMEMDGSTLKVKGKKRVNWGIGIRTKSTYAKVYLPAEYAGNLKICTASGEVVLSEDLSLERDLEVVVASGDVSAEKITADKIQITSASGELKLRELNAGQSTVTTASGDVWVEAVNGTMKCTTASGEVTIKGGSMQGKVGTASGDVWMALSELTGNLEIGTASGEVTLYLPESSSFAFKADTASGDINTFFDEVLSFSKKGDHAKGELNGNTAGITVEIGTASGDITVLR